MPVSPARAKKRADKPAPGPGPVPASADSRPVRVCTSDEYVDPRDLEPLEKNPRSITAEKRAALESSLRELGLFRPLLAWRAPDGRAVVIGGNQRLPVLREVVASGSPLVLPDGSRAPGVPVTWFRGTEAQARVVALRDNHADGDWDYPALAEYVTDLRDLGADDALLGLSGWSAEALADLGAAYPAPAPEATPTQAPSPAPAVPVAAPEAPAPQTVPASLQDPAEQLVGVQIGHIRGKIKAPTYERLVKALTEGLSNGIPEGGLDAAFVALLGRLP